MAAKKKGAGGNLTRSEVVTVRLDPKLKFAAELAARKQRRTISSFIEWTLEKALYNTMIEEPDSSDEKGLSAMTAMELAWDVDEADRFFKFAGHFPGLMNFDEERLLKIIEGNPYFYKKVWRSPDGIIYEKHISNLWFERVRSCWELLNKIVAGEESADKLPVRSTDEIEDTPF
ncbi:hypothetical protein VU08_01035 [Desulfobulbus sp. F5]|jgi:hypothetical protein|uniref:hypothetical protein n=1 Tax=Candidatus Electronema sp. V4 TaxID=3454756 RepID=UPI003F029742|nr:hypothetical protein [Desulfobulbus sp. F5]